MTRPELATPRGIYPTLQSAQQAAAKVPRGFVITTNPSKHIVYQADWTPLERHDLLVELEQRPHGWTIVITAEEGQHLRVDQHAARWLQTAALPAATDLLERLDEQHASRADDLRWDVNRPPRHRHITP